MGGRNTLIALLAMTAADASVAAGPSILQGAIYPSSRAPVASSGLTQSEMHVRSTAFGSSMAGAIGVAGANHRLRDRERAAASDSSAEAALLAGAGLLSPIPHVPLPLCTNVDRRDPCREAVQRPKVP